MSSDVDASAAAMKDEILSRAETGVVVAWRGAVAR